jgi:FkbM family methyltransferase
MPLGVRSLGRRLIGTHRRSNGVRVLHRLASFVESAYRNEGSDFRTNGERQLLGRLRVANFQTAFDVGANYGDWLWASLAAWPRCRVHAFEVAPLTFQRLQGRMAESAFQDRATLNCLGLSDMSGRQNMFYFPDNPELTSDLPRHETLRRVPFEAQLSTGDKYAGSHAIDTVDFLKIDVEGAEHRVLKGFSEYLAARKIHCVQFEYGAFSTQTRFLLGDYYAVLSQNYWIGKIYPAYVDFQEYDWTMEDFRFANYCCVSKLRPDLREILS